ncbi:MAG TPA: hypothetical protein VFX21_07115 [Acidimicrobiia bacterium]|nr:hypothetical protein [Acidimicrobiia bacterium]
MASTQHRASAGTTLTVLDAPLAEPIREPGPAVAPVERRAPWIFPVVMLTAALACWIVALRNIDPRDIGDYGLISAFPPAMYLAVAILTLSFCVVLNTRVRDELLGAHVVLLVLIIHATPSITYGTLRYAWAWKHLGIVDYFHRNHALWPESPTLTVYHNWPGFFTFVTHLTEASGLASAGSFAAWAPPFFELLFVLAVAAVISALTSDRRVIALGVWLFVLANWVGQDYFAPQAFAYFLYLVLFAILLRWFRNEPAPKYFKGLRHRLQRRVGRALVEDPPHPVTVPEAQQRTPLLFFVVLMMIAIATSHPLTPFVAIAGLLALAVTRTISVRVLPLVMATMTLAWLCTGAWPYVSPNARALFSEIGALGANVDSNLRNTSVVSDAQQLVSAAGRYVVVSMVALAALGVLRRLRVGRFEGAAISLMAAPIAVAIAGSYGGEVIFRVFLFALPFAAYLAARAFMSSDDGGRGILTTLALIVVSGVLLAGSFLAYYGKEQWTHFSTDEVRAAQAVFDNAPDDSLLIAFDRSMPYQFANYDRFTYVWILEEPSSSVRRILNDPVGSLEDWMEQKEYRRSYLLISRAQSEETAALGVLPAGTLDTVRDRLKASGVFDIVYDGPDATVFSLDPHAVTP